RASSWRGLPTISTRTDIDRRLEVAPEPLPPQCVERHRLELVQDEVAQRPRWRQIGHDPSRLDQRLEKRLPAVVGRTPPGRQHDRLARAAAPEDFPGTPPLAAPGHALTLHSH